MPTPLVALSRIDAAGVRLVVSIRQHLAPGAGGTRTNTPVPTSEDAPYQKLNPEGPWASNTEGIAGITDQPTDAAGARAVILLPLGPHDTASLMARWLQAEADTDLARQVTGLTRGIPGAVEALLTGWTRQGVIRIADGHAFIPARSPAPVLPDDDRFVLALDRLGEPARTVAAALSILGPLGRPALELTAVSTGLSTGVVHDGARLLVEAGIIDEVPGPDATTVRGWTFRLALTEHTVRERMSVVQRRRLSATAVEAFWADEDSATDGMAARPPALLDGPEARTYLADRIADAGTLVDRERAVAELTATAERVQPGTEYQRMFRWFRAAADLVDNPARDAALQRFAGAAYMAGDYRTGRAIAETMLRNPGRTLTALELQRAACLLLTVSAVERDWRTLSPMATARWWDQLPVPALAKVSGQALALGHLARWQEARELLARTQAVWNTCPQARAVPRCSIAAADLMLGRPERFQRELALPDAPDSTPKLSTRSPRPCSTCWPPTAASTRRKHYWAPTG